MAKDTSQKLKMTRIQDMLRMDSSKEEWIRKSIGEEGEYKPWMNTREF